MQLHENLAGSDLEKYKDYIKKTEVKEIELIDAPYHSTICSVCKVVCHDNCSLSEITTPGACTLLTKLIMLSPGKPSQTLNPMLQFFREILFLPACLHNTGLYDKLN